jgi:hypothetical protein
VATFAGFGPFPWRSRSYYARSSGSVVTAGRTASTAAHRSHLLPCFIRRPWNTRPPEACTEARSACR